MSFQDTTLESKDLINISGSPQKKSFAFHSSAKEDLSSSFIPSLSSPIVTEDLLINEKINFLSSDSDSSAEDSSLTYTKSLNSKLSSIFPSFEMSNLLLDSVPYGNNENLSVRSNEVTVSQRLFNESKAPYLKIPRFTIEKLLKIREVREDIGKDEVFEILNRGKNQRNIVEADKLKSAGKEPGIDLEKKNMICGCSMCIIS